MKNLHPVQRLFLALAIALVLGIVMVAVTGLHDSVGHADLGVVLGTKVAPDGQPSPRLEARLTETTTLYRAGFFPLVMVSGGVGREGFNEAQVMRSDLIKNGIPEDKIIVDDHGRTTYYTAMNTRRIMAARGLHSVFFVSQYFHMARTRLAMDRFGIHSVYYAHAPYFEWRDLYSLPREAIGLLFYAIRSYPIERTAGS